MIPYMPFGFLSPLTVVPNPVEDTDQFVQWANRFYEEVAFVVNARVYPYYTTSITSTATDIPNLPQFGAYILCVSGISSSLPAGVWALAKSDSGVAGLIAILQTQAGAGAWAANNLIVSSTTTNFQIRHDNVGVTGMFNVSIFGTQIGNQ